MKKKGIEYGINLTESLVEAKLIRNSYVKQFFRSFHLERLCVCVSECLKRMILIFEILVHENVLILESGRFGPTITHKKGPAFYASKMLLWEWNIIAKCWYHIRPNDNAQFSCYRSSFSHALVLWQSPCE